MPPKNFSSSRRIFEKISRGEAEEEGQSDQHRKDDGDDPRRKLERSLSSIDQLEDFEIYDDYDLIYREYEPVIVSDSSHYERFDRLGQSTWKTGRPSHWHSFLQTCRCVLETTLLSGCFIGLLLTLVIYLDINLSDLCYGYNFALVEISEYMNKIRTVSDMISSVAVQFWHLITLLLIFKFSLIKESQIISWNILAGLLTGMYKLLYGMFYGKDVFWKSYPCYGIFIIIATFNSMRVSMSLQGQVPGHVLMLVLRLMAQFLVGLPVAIVFIVLINPAYKNMEEIGKIAFASFVPVLIMIPKMIVRKSAESLAKVNHPGTSIFLLTAMYTCISLLYRTLQVQVDDTAGYAILSIIFGLLCTLERATIPYLDFQVHRLLKGKVLSMTEFMTPRRNRLMSDLTLVNMITEPVMIFASCTAMALLQYLYSRSMNGEAYDINYLCIVASKRIAIALLIEIFFNLVSVKVESYYFNMPVMKVWKKKKIWILFTLLLNAIISVMCFSHVTYAAMSTDDFFNGTLTCSSPFSRPTIRRNYTII